MAGPAQRAQVLRLGRQGRRACEFLAMVDMGGAAEADQGNSAVGAPIIIIIERLLARRVSFLGLVEMFSHQGVLLSDCSSRGIMFDDLVCPYQISPIGAL